MKLSFLGTGTSQGVPVIGCSCPSCTSRDPRDNRLRTAAMISDDQVNIAFDCGPDFRQQMLNNHFNSLEALLITHEHNDHVIGLDDVRPLNFMQHKPMPIFGLTRTLRELKDRFAYAFAKDPYPGAPSFELHPVEPFEKFEVAGIDILPLEILHGNLPILGYKIGSFCYITDAKTIDEQSIEEIKKCEVIVINALRHRSHHTHFNLEEALAFIKKVKPEKAYLTHLSHLFPPYQDLQKELPEGVYVAYDGLEIMIG